MSEDQKAPRATVRNITDLARLAGVSPGTVSRALAGKSLVNAKTRAKIEAIAREHGFRPNQMASGLRRQKTGVIGVVIPLGHDTRQQISDSFFMTLLGFLADELTAEGYDLMLRRVVPEEDADWLDRCDPPDRWRSTNHLCGPGYWFWLIPLASGAHSSSTSWAITLKSPGCCVQGERVRMLFLRAWGFSHR